MQVEYCNLTNGMETFIDSSISSLKAVLFHIGNEKSSVPITHGSHVKEIYESLNNFMGKIWNANHS